MTVDFLTGRAGADDLDGGAGIDDAEYAGSDAGVIVNLTTGSGLGGHAEGDVLANIEYVHGSMFDDHLIGDVDRRRVVEHGPAVNPRGDGPGGATSLNVHTRTRGSMRVSEGGADVPAGPSESASHDPGPGSPHQFRGDRQFVGSDARPPSPGTFPCSAAPSP